MKTFRVHFAIISIADYALSMLASIPFDPECLTHHAPKTCASDLIDRVRRARWQKTAILPAA
jgi:hypothetical protein